MSLPFIDNEIHGMPSVWCQQSL